LHNFLTAEGILNKINISDDPFKFKTKLQVNSIKTLKTKKGRPYLVLSLRDNTNTIRNVKKWIEDNQSLNVQLLKLDLGAILEFQGYFDKIYGLNILNSRLLNSNEFNLKDFVNLSDLNIKKLIDDLFNTISLIENIRLKQLLEILFSYKDIESKFISCPSSIKYHHSYKHGNLEHTVGMIKIFKQLITHYKGVSILDIDLVITCIILHDIGKIFEYTIYNGISKRLQLKPNKSHIVLGVELVLNTIKKIENFPNLLKEKIEHIILSHHGKRKWGAVEKPQLPEAKILHYLDMIDSSFKINMK
jgi:3'-5' exoribonuclease